MEATAAVSSWSTRRRAAETGAPASRILSLALQLITTIRDDRAAFDFRRVHRAFPWFDRDRCTAMRARRGANWMPLINRRNSAVEADVAN